MERISGKLDFQNWKLSFNNENKENESIKITKRGRRQNMKMT